MSGRILIVEGNVASASRENIAHGGVAYGEGYAEVLKRIAPSVSCTITRPADAFPAELSAAYLREHFDGAVWTGSALTAYQREPAVDQQLRFAEVLFEAGLPVFGSCWGMQIAATVLGGAVRKNPKGRELGYARAIELTPEGREHAMYAGKSTPFDALAVHNDEVHALPAGAVLLATNAFSEAQAFAYEREGISFWGVQYHPEFDHAVMAAIYRRLSPTLRREGVLAEGETAAWPAEPNPSVDDFGVRTREIANWLKKWGQ